MIRDSERTLIVFIFQKGCRIWLRHITRIKTSAGYLIYPVDVRDTAESGIGQTDNRHLHYLAESIFVNVGGLLAEVSSPPVKQASVGVTIVVRGWESQPQGEGSQSVGIPKQNNQMITRRNLL